MRLEDGGARVSAADELRALTAVATPGPWEVSKRNTYRGKVAATGWGASVFTTVDPSPEWISDSIDRAAKDAELIVWLRNHAAALTDLIEWANDAPHHDGCNARHNGSPQPAAARPYPCKCGRYAALAALEAR